MIVLVVLGLVALVILLESLRPRGRPELTHRRGARLVSKEAAAETVGTFGHGPYTPPAGFPGFLFGGLFLPFHFAFTGFVWFGSVGSGKTLTFVPFLRSVLDLVGRPGSRARLCLYDPKREFSSLVASLPSNVPVYRLNFLDRRSVWWDWAADFCTPDKLYQLAHFIVRVAKNELQPYFAQAGQAVLYAFLLALSVLAPGAWRQSDLPIILASIDRLRFFLKRVPEGRAALAMYLAAESGRDVLATIASAIDRLRVVAACDRHARTPFSIRRFLDEQAVLLLELVDSASELQKAYYQLAVRMLSDGLLDRVRPDWPTALGFDELVSLGEIDLVPLTTKGRASGAVVAATVMSLPALEESLGGPNKAKALLDNLQSQAILKLDSGPTAEHCSQLIGEEEVSEITHSVSNPRMRGDHPRARRRDRLADGRGRRAGVHDPPAGRRARAPPVRGRPLPHEPAARETGRPPGRVGQPVLKLTTPSVRSCRP